jgi:hypothetical protein
MAGADEALGGNESEIRKTSIDRRLPKSGLDFSSILCAPYPKKV